LVVERTLVSEAIALLIVVKSLATKPAPHFEGTGSGTQFSISCNPEKDKDMTE
jgi:hypothetical protein